MNILAIFQRFAQIAIIKAHLFGKPRDGSLFFLQFLKYQIAYVYIIVHTVYRAAIRNVDFIVAIEALQNQAN